MESVRTSADDIQPSLRESQRKKFFCQKKVQHNVKDRGKIQSSLSRVPLSHRICLNKDSLAGGNSNAVNGNCMLRDSKNNPIWCYNLVAVSAEAFSGFCSFAKFLLDFASP